MSDTIAGRYTLIDPIARGGSGTVWRAWDQRRNHVCAAKVLRQRDSADLLRFVREQSVKIDHPHVLAPYGWAAEDEHVVIAMDLSDGGTLENAIQDHGAFSDAVAEEILRQLISALQFVHAEGWIHRDVKPANLMMNATGTGRPLARLADFGIATQGEDARLTRIGTVVGTPGYIAPELMQGADPDPSQDLFAAGVVAMRMVRPDADRGTTPTPEDAIEAFGEDSLLGAEVAALLDPDPAVRHDGAMSLMERLDETAQGEFGEATTRDGEIFEIFQTLDPLPEAWQDIVAGFAEPPRQERTGENIAQSGDAGVRSTESSVTGPQPTGPRIDAPTGGRVRDTQDLTPPPGGEPLVGPTSGPAGTLLHGMPSGLGSDGRAVPSQAPPADGSLTSAAVQGPLPEGQRTRAGLLGAAPAVTGEHAPQRRISWSGSQTPQMTPTGASMGTGGVPGPAGSTAVTAREQTLRTPAETQGAALGGAAGTGYRTEPSGMPTAPGASIGSSAPAGPAPAAGTGPAPAAAAAPAGFGSSAQGSSAHGSPGHGAPVDPTHTPSASRPAAAGPSGHGAGAPARTSPAGPSGGAAARSGPLAAVGVRGPAGWAVLGVLGLVIAAIIVVLLILLGGDGGEEPGGDGTTAPTTSAPTEDPTDEATQEPTEVPTTIVTPDGGGDFAPTGSQLGNDPGGNSLGG